MRQRTGKACETNSEENCGKENICAEQILLIYRKTFAIDCMSDWLLGTELDASC